MLNTASTTLCKKSIADYMRRVASAASPVLGTFWAEWMFRKLLQGSVLGDI